MNSSLYDAAKGGLSVALERPTEKDSLIDAELAEQSTLEELSERAHQTILIVIPNRELSLTDLDGGSYGAYIHTINDAKQGVHETSAGNSIASSNFSIILLPERMKPFLSLSKDKDTKNFKIWLVPSSKQTLQYVLPTKKHEIVYLDVICPDYLAALKEILSVNKNGIFTHVLRQKTKQEIEAEKKTL